MKILLQFVLYVEKGYCSDLAILRSDNTFRSNFVKMEILIAFKFNMFQITMLPLQSLAYKKFYQTIKLFKLEYLLAKKVTKKTTHENRLKSIFLMWVV